ncbi:MAG: hypothetical protein CVU09_00430 [Bacteroidetes bacterium HGW-Bacteroidetes-4]|jgi:hypothetical protein|nr:MAG: hypothetical protein CVU09_00430 [Bacteroidetes bacterium HGW-Bacteroidetes-4]
MSKKSFALAYGNLPGNIQSNVRDEIMSQCGWATPQYFSMKKNHTRALTDEESEKVEAVFEKYGFNAWTGEPIKVA